MSTKTKNMGDNIIGGLFTGVLFTAVTALLFTWIAQNTSIFNDSIILNILRQILIGALFIIILSVFANYRVLKIMLNHAYTLLKMAIISQVVLFGGGFLLLGLFILQTSSLGFIIIGIGGVIILSFMFLWSRIRERLKLTAKWLAVSIDIVLQEPGMIFLSIVQSFVIGIGLITEAILVFAFNSYAEASNLDSDLAGYIQYIIGFVYLVFVFFILYYFDGAVTFMAYVRIKGDDPTIGQGINAASKKMASLFGFAVLTAVVKSVAQALRRFAYDTGNKRGDSIQAQILAGVFMMIIGIAEWIYHLISFFTIPVIVIRQKNTMDAMRESKDLFSRNAWNVILSDMGFGWGSTIIYLLTAVVLAVGGFFYGYSIAATAGLGGPVLVGIIVAIIALIFGLSITKFFIRPLYTTFVTTIYVYASEGPNGLKAVPKGLVNKIGTSLNSPKARPRSMR